MTLGKMLNRAAVWRAGCQCLDCYGGRTAHQQRRAEERAWRAEAFDVDDADDDTPTPKRSG